MLNLDQTDVPTRLEAFIGEERNNYGHPGTNLIAFALSHAARYDRFLRIILARYNEVGTKFVDAMNSFMASRKPGNNECSQDDLRDMDRQRQLTTLLHLEIESFYLHAKIFLDHVARFLEHNFGPERGLSLDSHDDLTKYFQRYKSAKSLNCSESFQQTLVTLKTRIADYRDYQIAHSKNPRLTYATTWDADRKPRIQGTSLFPNELELQKMPINSEDLSTLRADLDAYIELVIPLIVENREKSRYLRAANGVPA